MAIAYINKTIEVPNVASQTIEHDVIGDFTRTALGGYRADVIDRKRIWRLEVKYITKTQYDNINDYLDTIKGGLTYFWLDEFGGSASSDSIDAIVEISSDERVVFKDSSGNLHDDGRIIELTITEV